MRGRPHTLRTDNNQQPEGEMFDYELVEADGSSSSSGVSSDNTSLEVFEGSPNIVSDKTANAIFSALDKAAGETRSESKDEVSFAKRGATVPAPKSGDIISHTFPAKGENEAFVPVLNEENSEGPLTILRYAPQGEQTTILANISVTFSQPMIPLGTLESISKAKNPCSLAADGDNGRYSEEKGAWRWIGTQMIKFEPHGGRRLPMSTRFEVCVSKENKSVAGNSLAKPFTFSFDTPTVNVTRSYPSYTTTRNPFVFLMFDQRVPPKKMINHLKLRAAGTLVQLELVENVEELLEKEKKESGQEEELFGGIQTKGTPFLQNLAKAVSEKSKREADETPSALCSLIRSGQSKNEKDLAENEKPSASSSFFIVARIAPTAANKKILGDSMLLPSASRIDIVVESGAPSAEGALCSSTERSFSFNTYSTFNTQSVNDTKELAPCDTFNFSFNNAIDSTISSFSLEQWNELLAISPPLKLTKVSASGRSLVIQGETKGKTKYSVSLGGWLFDQYGQHFRDLALAESENFTFSVGNARQLIRAHREGFFTVDPATVSAPTFDVATVNYHILKVSLFKVSEHDFEKSVWSRTHVRARNVKPQDQTAHELIGSVGTLVVEKTITIANYQDDQAITTQIPVIEALGKATKGKGPLFGHVAIVVDIMKEDHKDTSYNKWEHRSRHSAWMQITDLGVDLFYDQVNLVSQCFVSSLRTGTCVPGANITLAKESGVTDKSGMVSIRNETTKNRTAMIVTSGNQSLIVPNVNPLSKSNACQVKFFVTDDRTLYKPNEEVHFKGFARFYTYDVTSNSMQLRCFPKGSCTGKKPAVSITYTASDARRVKIDTQTISIDEATGGFHGSFTIGDTVNLGSGTIQFTLQGIQALANQLSNAATIKQLGNVTVGRATHNHVFRIEEFRRPEYSVSASRVDANADGSLRNAFFGDSELALVECDAQYYSGGPLNNAKVQWRVSGSSTSFSPPGVPSGYQFGPSGGSTFYRCSFPGRNGSIQAEKHSLGVHGEEEIVTSPSGTHRLGLDFSASFLQQARPMLLQCEATVTNVNRQALAASTSVLVHPSQLYVGCKRSAHFIALSKASKGDKNDFFDFIVVDVDGKSVAGVAVELTIKQGSKVIHEEVCISKRKGKEAFQPMRFNLFADNFKYGDQLQSGPVTIEATVTDKEGRSNTTTASLYISNGVASTYSSLRSNAGTTCPQDTITVIPNKETYEVGDKARMLVSSPWAQGNGASRSGMWSLWNATSVVRVERFDFPANTPEFEIEFDILEEYIGRGTTAFCVDLVGEAEREGGKVGDPTRTAYAHQKVALDVPVVSKRLKCTVNNEENVRPGETTTVNVCVKDANGLYVPDCSLCVYAVDESVLSLAGYSLQDPLDSFYQTVKNDHLVRVRALHSRSSVYLVNLDTLSLAGQLGIPAEVMQKRGMMMSRCAAPGAKMMKCSMAPNSFGATAEMMSMDCAEDAGMGEEPTVGEIKIRTNFNALAAWIPNGNTPSFKASDKVTEEQAQSSFTFTMPDSLTRYRIFCIAVKDNLFGKQESSMTAALPLQVKPSPPRFLQFGDESQISVVVRNQSSKPVTGACVVLRSLNEVVRLASPVPGIRVSIPPNDRVEVRFAVSATKCAGTARFQAAVVGSEDTSDAASFDFPVWTPATSEAFATYGELDEDGALVLQHIQSPSEEEVWPQFGELSVSVTSTALQTMVDAFLFIYHYQHASSEARASRVLSCVSMRDIVAAFSKVETTTNGKPAPTSAEIDAIIKEDLEGLQKMQHANGGFGFWSSNRVSPFVTIHVGQALAQAMIHGVVVDRQMAERVEQFCVQSTCENHLRTYYPSSTSFDDGLCLNILAKAHSVRRKLVTALGLSKQEELTKEALTLHERVQKYRGARCNNTMIEVLAYLLTALFLSGKKKEYTLVKQSLLSSVQETAETACFATSASSVNAGFYILQSSRRVDALVLEAIIQTEPTSSLCSKLLKGLFAHRVRGCWRTTQENASVLMAADAYFRAFEKEEPDFEANAWLGSTYCLGQAFKGRSVDTHTTNVPMQSLCEQQKKNKIATTSTTGPQHSGNVPLILQKVGAPGRLYYRVALKYAPKSLDLPSLAAGFTVTRRYSSVDNDKDVTFDTNTNTYKVKAGSRVRVSLTMTNQTRRYHVALVDSLPAAFEALNPALKGTGDIPPLAGAKTNGKYCWWRGPWYEHQNFRDERVEAFASYLNAGVHEFTYVARCTQFGTFVAPPAKAEEMYSPEIFGRTSNEKVIVIA